MKNFEDLLYSFHDRRTEVCYSYRYEDQIIEESFQNLYSKVTFFRDQLSDLPQNSVVLIASSQMENLLPIFLGGLSLNLRPAFVAYPSQKVSIEDYQSKLTHILSNFSVNRVMIDSSETKNFKDIDQAQAIIPFEIGSKYNYEKFSVANSNPSFIQFSSGSTGVPKAMQFSFKSTIKHTGYLQDRINMQSQDYLLSWLPLYHDMGLIAATLYPLFQGKKFHMISPFQWINTPSLFFTDGYKLKATHSWMPNFAYELLSQRCKDIVTDLSSWRMLASCAEPVIPDTVIRFYETFKDRGLRADCMAATYAMAENTFAMTHKVFDMKTSQQFVSLDNESYLNNQFVLAEDTKSSTMFASCGTAVGNTQIECPVNSIGSIKIRGESCLSNYLGDNKKIIDKNGYFNTGDIGFIYNDELFICGRESDLMIVRGVNIYPQNLERLVDQVPGIVKGRCVALSDWNNEESTEEIIILAEVTESQDIVYIKNELRQRMRAYLDFDIRRITLLPRGWLRKTSSGKIARRPNLKKFHEFANKPVLVIGDSHIYSWNQSDDLYNNDSTSENVFLRQIPIISAENIHADERLNTIRQNLENLPDFSTIVLFIGEQDIRNLIPFWMRTRDKTLSEATREVLNIHYQWIQEFKTKYEKLNFCWLLPPPPGEGLKPHPRFLSQQYLSNDLYYHYQADQTQRVQIAKQYRKLLSSGSPIPVIDYWDHIADDNLVVNPIYIRDISHLKNVRQLFQDHLEAKIGCLFGPLKKSIDSPKITLVIENINYEMKKLLSPFLKNEPVEETLLLEELDSMAIVRIVSELQSLFEVEVPSQWMNKKDWETFKGFCEWVMQHRVAQTPFEN